MNIIQLYYISLPLSRNYYNQQKYAQQQFYLPKRSSKKFGKYDCCNTMGCLLQFGDDSNISIQKFLRLVIASPEFMNNLKTQLTCFRNGYLYFFELFKGKAI